MGTELAVSGTELSCFPSDDGDTCIEQALAASEAPTTLRFSMTAVTDDAVARLEEICGPGGLEQLVLRGCRHITGKGLESLSGLKSLDLTDTKITDEALAVLERCPGITELRLSGCNCLTGEALRRISGLEALKLLSLRECSWLTDDALLELGTDNLPSLQILSVSLNPLGDKAVSNLEGAAGITHLSLRRTSITDGAVEILGRREQLVYLSLAETGISSQSIQWLTALPNLTALYLGNTAVDREALEYLSRIPKLRNLGLCGTRLTSMEKLSLESCGIII